MYTNIKSFEDACAFLKRSTSLPDVSMLPEEEQDAFISHYKLTVIAQALNENWKPNWGDDDEYKYYPWFEVEEDQSKPSGFGLSYHVCVRWYSYTAVGSRLCYKSREIAKYAGTQFIDLYEKYFLFKK